MGSHTENLFEVFGEVEAELNKEKSEAEETFNVTKKSEKQTKEKQKKIKEYKKTKNPKEKKKGFTFGRGLLVYAAVGLVLVVIILFVFWDFIGDYEKSMPVYGMDSVISVFETGDISNIVTEETVTKIGAYEDESDFIEKYNEYISGKEITFLKSPEFTDKNPVYIVYADGEACAEAYLKKYEVSGSNFKNWTLKTLSLDNYTSLIYDSVNVTISVPTGSAVTVNGVEILSDDLQSTALPESLSVLSDYLSDDVLLDNYEISDLMETPEITATLDGTDLTFSVSDNSYIAGWPVSETFVSEMTEYVTPIAKQNAYAFINKAGRILSYVMPDSELYESLQLTTTYWYPATSIESYNLTELTIDNFKMYGEKCFSCDIKYNLYVDFISGYYVADTTEEGEFTWYFVYSEADSKWYLTVQVYK